MKPQITVVIPNYKTPVLIKRVVGGMLKFYPRVRLLLIDNNSKDASTKYIREMAGSKCNIRAILNHVNVGHGPAMHQGLCICETPFVCLIDSDCIIRRKGALERMEAHFSNPKVYAVGEIVRIDAGGNTRKKGVRYVLPSRMMIDRRKYQELPPFNHHGAPAVANIRAAAQKGYILVNFPKIDEYIYHPGHGRAKGGSHKKVGIPGWRIPAHYLPKDAPTARQRLKGARPVLLGKWE